MGKLFLSHRVDFLAQHLVDQLINDDLGIFTTRLILVPNASLKQWLLLELAKQSPEQGIAGVSVLTLQESLKKFCRPSGYTEIFCSLFQALPRLKNQKLRAYLEKTVGSLVEFSSWLTESFLRYSHFCPSLFEKKEIGEEWQKELIQNLFVEGSLRHPLKNPLPIPPVHCFGFDFLPEWIWETFQFPCIYIFSPCLHFWEDLCSDRERKRLHRFWEKRKTRSEQRKELDTYLQEAPSILANWGQAGRETLKILDRFSLEVFEHYEEDEKTPSSTLTRLQRRLLEFDLSPLEPHPDDLSLQITKTGSSLLREVQHLHTTILDLIHSKNIPCSEIAILAPDIQPYASLIQFVFSDLPFRIAALDIGQKSFLYQGMHRLFDFENVLQQEFMDLFENPSFTRARGWDKNALAWIRARFAEKLWDEEALLEKFIYLLPEEDLRLATSSADLLEQWIGVMQEIRTDISSLQTPRTLAAWAQHLPPLLEKYFFLDKENEMEEAAWNFFEQTMNELKHLPLDDLFPFAPIKALLKRPIPGGQINASHLHAIRFASLAEGSATPVKALFLIGMSEENFPRKNSQSSLDILRGEKIYTFEPSDRDRYFFLQSLFAAKEFLHISYSHLSPSGSPVYPSPLVEELKRSLDGPAKECQIKEVSRNLFTPKKISWPTHPPRPTFQQDLTIHLSELSSLARHPWSFYLEKQFGIRLERSPIDSLSQKKKKILRATPHTKSIASLLRELPSGLCGEILTTEIQENASLWSEQIATWGVSFERLLLKANSFEKRHFLTGWEMPPIEIYLDNGTRIKIIGEIKNFSPKGFLYTGEDSLGSLLKTWPECLAALIASETLQIYFVDAGKIKSVQNPLLAMKDFLTYFLLAKETPSPLIPDWADAILRKGIEEIQAKEEKMILGKERFEDTVFQWVSERIDLPPLEDWLSSWKEPIMNNFSQLCALYPTRKKSETL